MISIEVQFEPYGDVHVYSSPDIVEHGDRVIVDRDGNLTVATVVAVGTERAGPVDEIVRVIGPSGDAEEAEPDGGGE